MKSLSFGLAELLAIVGLGLDAVAIIIAVVIYKLSANTSQKVFEDSLARALAKANMPDGIHMPPFRLSEKQKKDVIKKLKRCLKKRTIVRVVNFAITLKKALEEDRLVQLLEYLKVNDALTWSGDLENSTIINIINEDLIYESISSC